MKNKSVREIIASLLRNFCIIYRVVVIEMAFKIIAVAVLLAFYGCYFIKMNTTHYFMEGIK
jgi:hypothetical protein